MKNPDFSTLLTPEPANGNGAVGNRMQNYCLREMARKTTSNGKISVITQHQFAAYMKRRKAGFRSRQQNIQDEPLMARTSLLDEEDISTMSVPGFVV
jgi:hypothetical protein